MAAIGIDVTIRSRLPGMERALRDIIPELVQQLAEGIRDTARASMTEPKTGRPYLGYTASAPGQAPAIRPFPLYPTGGKLFASIAALQVTSDHWYVVAADDTAGYLEYGAPRARILPRPFMRPAATAEAKKMELAAPVKVKVKLESVPWA